MKAIVFSSVLAGTALMVGPASAEIYLVRQPQPRYVACYVREYVPAKVLVNTRGRLVAKETTVWEISGDRWNRVRSPAVYMETRRVVAPDHSSWCPSPVRELLCSIEGVSVAAPNSRPSG